VGDRLWTGKPPRRRTRHTGLLSLGPPSVADLRDADLAHLRRVRDDALYKFALLYSHFTHSSLLSSSSSSSCLLLPRRKGHKYDACQRRYVRRPSVYSPFRGYRRTSKQDRPIRTDSVATFRSSPHAPSGEIFWFQMKNMFRYSCSTPGTDCGCCHRSATVVLTQVLIVKGKNSYVLLHGL